MKAENVFADPRSFALLQDIVFVMASQKLRSLPSRIVENWSRESVLDNLIDANLLKNDGGTLQLNTQTYCNLVSKRIRSVTELSFPAEISNCMGPPWNEKKRFLTDCLPRSTELISTHDEGIRQSIRTYIERTTFGKDTANAKPRSLNNVMVLPVFHERDYLQYVKIKRAIRHFRPDIIGIEGLGQDATRHIVSSLFTPRSFTGLPFCIIMKQYSSQEERMKFFMEDYKDSDGIKAYITAESDLAAIVSSCIGDSIPFFSMGVPEDCIKDRFPRFFEIERKAWYTRYLSLQNEARQKTITDLDILCDFSKIEEIENHISKGRTRTSLRYKKQMIWCENYMASRIFDFCSLASFDLKVLVFVGLCHSRTLRSKLVNGSWRYIPPINERVKLTLSGSTPSRLAAYLLLEDFNSSSFISRLERTISPSPLHVELFGMREDDVVKFVKHNTCRTLVTTNWDEVIKTNLIATLEEFLKKNPSKYRTLTKLVEQQIRNNCTDTYAQDVLMNSS